MIAAVTMVKNEEDIIGYTISHLLNEDVDLVIVADNLSSDGTREILESFGDQVLVEDDPEVGYYQSEKMTKLARLAMQKGASWIIPFDADELWHCTHGMSVGLALKMTRCQVVDAPLYDHRPKPTDDLSDPNPFTRMPWVLEEPLPLVKVAFRRYTTAVIHQGNHSVDRPGPHQWGVLSVRHFPYRSLEQTTRKMRQGAAAYKETDLSEDMGAHWRALGVASDEQMRAYWDELHTWDCIRDPAPYKGTY